MSGINKSHEGASVFKLWPAPDMSVLSGGRRQSPKMPSELFGSVWPLISDLAQGAGSPVEYTAVSVLAVAASLIGGKRKVRPFATSNWAEPCILWAAAVGDPSSNKSPGIEAATLPLRSMDAEHAERHRDVQLDYETRIERAKIERDMWRDTLKTAAKEKVGAPSMPTEAVTPDEPERRRLMVQDATPEAVASILSGNSQGTLHLRDELAGWLMSFDRYSPGGREFWLEAYGGRHHIVDRKGAKGPISIDFNGVSVLGGIQPDKLSACLLTTADDGLVARFLWAWPEPVPYHRPRAVADMGKLETIYRRLDGLGWGFGSDGKDCAVTLSLDDAAATVFEDWIKEAQDGDDGSSLFKGFVGKLRGTVLRLSLVAELLAWAASDSLDEPRSISAGTVGDAIDFAEEFAKPSALRVFGDAALPVAERNAAVIARWISRRKPKRVNAREMKRDGSFPGPKKGSELDEALAELVDADWLKLAPAREGDTVGRQRKDFIVNPQIVGER